MTNVSSLYNFRSVIGTSKVNASSASRAVRNALKRYAAGTVKLEDIVIQHKVKAGPNGEEWQTSASGMELLHKNAAAITPATPKERTKKAEQPKAAEGMTLRKAMSSTAAILQTLKTRDMTPEEIDVVVEALGQLSHTIEVHRATIAAEIAESEELAQA